MLATLGLCVVLLSATANAERYYATGVTEADLTSSQGVWTGWLNYDTPDGTGEYEDVEELRARDEEMPGECMMFCKFPLAMDVLPVNNSHNWDDINVCTVNQEFDASKGYLCYNYDQYFNENLPAECISSICDANQLNRMGDAKCGKCPDVKVNYFCEGTSKEALVAEFCSDESYQYRMEDRREWRENGMKRTMEAREEAQKKRNNKKNNKKNMPLAKLLRELIADME